MAGRRPGGRGLCCTHPPGTRLSLLTGLLTIAPLKAYLRTLGSLAIFNIKIKAFLHTCGLVSPGAGCQPVLLVPAAGGHHSPRPAQSKDRVAWTSTMGRTGAPSPCH